MNKNTKSIMVVEDSKLQAESHRALQKISEQSGILYDPEIVVAATKLFREKAFSFT